MSEPTTAAGRALAARAKRESWGNWEGIAQFEILAIEAEARATADATPAWIACPRCGAGTVNTPENWLRHSETNCTALAAEKERVARLREALGTLCDYTKDWGEADSAEDELLDGIRRVLAETAPAEPRWPSGPDAERELAAALERAGAAWSWQDANRGGELFARAILAALQEKRDPGE